jgi:hypothetical protein
LTYRWRNSFPVQGEVDAAHAGPDRLEAAALQLEALFPKIKRLPA